MFAPRVELSAGFWREFDALKPKLAHRAEGFAAIFRHLDSLQYPPLIVETGCVRRPDSYGSDGASTLLWNLYCQYRPETQVISIDVNPAHVQFARAEAPLVAVKCADSVQFLSGMPSAVERIDLLYLDSFDLDCQDPLPSARHHLDELKAALPRLSPRSWVVVDDAQWRDGMATGKALMVGQYLRGKGSPVVLQGYMVGWTGIQNDAGNVDAGSV